MNQPSQMSEKSKKGIITELDVSIILQRYTAATVLALLQEVAQIQDAKIDWNALVRRTKTGITNPREYQMLWRHLAYRQQLVDKIQDGSKPLDDDSDLEYELEAFPPVNNEASMEAASCVKVLIASGTTCGSGLEKGLTIEAPLIINIPNKNSTGNSSDNQQAGSSLIGTNITVPVCVQKQPVPVAVVASSTEELDKNGCGAGSGGSLPPRRKRKPWSAAEDMELFAAVQKCGEGNWANILKGDFKGDRTASQLAQRWNIIKKRNNGNLIGKTGSQLSEVHLAARRAINMALDQPGVDNLKASSSHGTGRTKSSITSVTSMRPIIADTRSGTSISKDQTGEDTSGPTKTFSNARPKASSKSVVNGPDPVKAAAVAAGARIATQSATAAILKQQLKSAIHVKTGVANFRDLHTPNPSCSHEHNANVGPSYPVSTATHEIKDEIKGTTNSSSASPPKKVQDETMVSAKVEGFQNTSKMEVGEKTALPVEPVMMDNCEIESKTEL